jgi:hypothetical protein
LRERTGRGWDKWFALLGAWGGTAQPHTEIAPLAGPGASGPRLVDAEHYGCRRLHSEGSNVAHVSVVHEKVPDAEEAARLKAYWRGRLSVLKEVLEAIG